MLQTNPQEVNTNPFDYSYDLYRDTLTEPLLSEGSDENRKDEKIDVYKDDCIAISTDDKNTSNAAEDESPNVRWILLFTFFVTAGRSVWNTNALATYVFLLSGDDPEAVGSITAIMGMSQLAMSYPSGILADKFRRDVMVQISSAFLLTAVAASLVALKYSASEGSYTNIALALCLWGFFMGVSEPPITALLADSAPRGGDCTRYFTKRNVVIQFGDAVGPCVALIMFAVLGDQWSIRDCSIVIAIGQLLSLPALVFAWLVSDDDCATRGGRRNRSGSASARDRFSSAEKPSRGGDTRICGCVPAARKVPSLIALADVVAGLASGMSVRFFAIFLYENLKLRPTMVQVIYVVNPLLQAVLMKVGEKFAVTAGNLHVTVAFKLIGITLMVSMILAYTFSAPVYVVCVVLVVRTGFMNSTKALTRSMLMNAVPERERAKWSCLEAMNQFSWSGSAFLGGLLVNYNGIIFNFVVTALFQSSAQIPLVALFAHENRTLGKVDASDNSALLDEEKSTAATASDTSDDMSSSTSSNDNTVFTEMGEEL